MLHGNNTSVYRTVFLEVETWHIALSCCRHQRSAEEARPRGSNFQHRLQLLPAIPASFSSVLPTHCCTGRCLRATSIVYSALATAFCGNGCRRQRSSATESPHRRRGHCCTVLRLRGLLLSGRLFSAKFARMLGMQLRPDLEHLTEWFSRSFNIAKPNSSDVYRVRFAYELSLGFFNRLFATTSRMCQLTAHSLFVLCQACVFSIFVSPNLHRSDCQEQLLFWGF